MTESAEDLHVVFYDGVCGLCDRTVQFLLRIDRQRILSFAPLQGTTAARLTAHDSRFDDARTILFVEDYGTARERVSVRSTAVLRILARLGGLWRAVSWLRVIPRPLRDLAYRIVARYRYRWFGRFDSCRLPAAAIAARFLD